MQKFLFKDSHARARAHARTHTHVAEKENYLTYFRREIKKIKNKFKKQPKVFAYTERERERE